MTTPITKISINELKVLKEILGNKQVVKEEREEDTIRDIVVETTKEELQNMDRLDEERIEELVQDFIDNSDFVTQNDLDDKIDDIKDNMAARADVKELSQLLNKIIKLNNLKVK